jgi:hypothetical protein
MTANMCYGCLCLCKENIISAAPERKILDQLCMRDENLKSPVSERGEPWITNLYLLEENIRSSVPERGEP